MWTLLTITSVVLIWLGLFAWRYDVHERKQFEATLTRVELARFHGFRLTAPWHRFETLIEMERAHAAAERKRPAKVQAEYSDEIIPLAPRPPRPAALH